MPAPAGQLYFELVDDEKVIVCQVLRIKINELYWLRAAVVPLGQTIDDSTLEQQFRCCLVHFHQPMPGCLLQVVNSTVNTHVIKPRLSVAQIKPSQRRSKTVPE